MILTIKTTKPIKMGNLETYILKNFPSKIKVEIEENGETTIYVNDNLYTKCPVNEIASITIQKEVYQHGNQTN